MPDIEFVGRSRSDPDNSRANPCRLLNLYREPSGGRSQYVLREVLGQETWADTIDGTLWAMYEWKGTVYAIIGGGLYSVDSGGNTFLASLGAVTINSDVILSANNDDLTMTANGNYYRWDGSSLTQPTVGAFSDFGSVDFLNQRTLLTEQDGRKFQWSDPADASTLDGLDFATAESNDDNIVRGVVISGNYWVFKETSTEIWYPTGSTDSTLAFDLLAGGVIDTGLKGLDLVAKVPSGGFFIGNDGIVYLASGTSMTPISDPSVESAIANGTPTNCFYYEDRGHKIACIRFSDRPTWCCDISTNEWHERAEGVDFDPWDTIATVGRRNGDWIAGGRSGALNRMVRNAEDVGMPLARRAVSQTVYWQGQRFRVSFMELWARKGEEVDSRPVRLWTRLSGDEGVTWGRERWRDLGETGIYDQRVSWRSLGQFRSLNVEINMTDPVSRPIDASGVLEIA